MQTCYHFWAFFTTKTIRNTFETLKVFIRAIQQNRLLAGFVVGDEGSQFLSSRFLFFKNFAK
ncbi:MAG: hypothetical protein A2746_00840 [Candidatus Yanofskybacteria bacterium RIFCSPHIGHO2_01_FULL_44_22]|uniref:Uncharacterized protein n=1 Tax=Candidatus Yanofskybacteria bacterium RIFCSPHIGHO2_01_FULL_44_22 TaxID=1802669 RepID=A0A1F8EYC8_9BACT|nr:MAG: hypothetical protein A2746_00840 [Candidatus Yanofskybacteria bacterium RIFCSPHIGHO2_01_FULL_44_22]